MVTINRITRDDTEEFRDYLALGTNALDLYQGIATKSAIYPGQGTPMGLVYCALKVNGEAGELAEHVGKAMRDDGLIPVLEHSGECSNDLEYASLSGKLTPERRAAIIKEIGDKLWYLGALCNELNTTLSEVAAVNLEKLRDRGERGKLQGSGDDR